MFLVSLKGLDCKIKLEIDARPSALVGLKTWRLNSQCYAFSIWVILDAVGGYIYIYIYSRTYGYFLFSPNGHLLHTLSHTPTGTLYLSTYLYGWGSSQSNPKNPTPGNLNCTQRPLKIRLYTFCKRGIIKPCGGLSTTLGHKGKGRPGTLKPTP